MLTDEQKKYATQAFLSLDDRHTGSIPNTKETVIDAVRLSGLNPTEIEIDQLIKGTDFGDKLTKDDFLSMMTKVDWKQADDVRDMLKEDFRLFVDNRAVINEDEFIFILTREGRERLSLDEAKQVVAKFDKDHEGNIQIEDLIDKLLAIAPT
ncbi:calcium vector protein-like isoform X2 [Mercenaria mercenaria]|uniref:calcium vector protein-like isoform X2 n=1 Tax=Mercenaria mercenaria TaxID=6596 RepID=UPI00234F95D0|nr:calcium vector protein-like isoform X2 [Mercenaria mercenaria]